jgi:hypothetical protein
MTQPPPSPTPDAGPPTTPAAPARSVPASNAVLARVLRYGALLALGIAVVGAVLGYIFVGWTGVAGALVGTAMAVVFLGITAISILIANRFMGSEMFFGAFFGIVLGSWMVKFVAFFVLLVSLKGQPWLNPTVTFICLVAGVIGSLVVDLIVIMRSRLPYASDARLPGDEKRG